MSSIDSQLNRELQQLFNSFSDADGTLGEWASHGYSITDPERKSILFVGLNPSYRDKPQQNSYGYEGYPAQEQYPQFFAPFQRLANDCQRGDDWAYTDVLYPREMQIDKLPEVLTTPEGHDFIVRQLQFTLRLLDYLKPDLMVVCHPEAHRFFGKSDLSHPQAEPWMGYTFEFVPSFGVEVITGLHNDTVQKGAKGTSLVGTPVLFTESLTDMAPQAQQRLAWQMKQILKFRPLFFSIDKHGPSHQVSKHITQVTLKIVALQRAKTELIKKGEYHAAAQQRDQVAEIAEEVLELLVKAVGCVSRE